MKNKLLKTLTPLFLVVLLIATLASVFVITAGAETTGKTGTYEKVTSAPDDWSGTYLIVYEAEKGAVAFDGSLDTLDVESNTVPVTITDNKIECTDDLAKSTFTIAAVDGGGYSIQSASGYYIGRTTKKNGLDSSTETTYTNSISLNADGTVTIKSSSGPTLQVYGSTSYRFRFYGSTQKAITLYKLENQSGGEPGGGTGGNECQHTVVTDEAVKPTCTETGLTEGSHCSACNKVLVAQTEIPATGHNYVDGVCTVCKATKPEYNKPVALSNIESTYTIIIVAEAGGKYYALSNNNGTSKAPDAVEVTITDGAISTKNITNIKNLYWNITYDKGNITIYPAGTTETWLYCTNANNGVRVGTNDNKNFTIDNESGYLKNTATSRYLGVYIDKPDWRCYDNTKGNIASQEFSYYYVCPHTNIKEVAEVSATCTEKGYTAGVYCNDCETYISGHAEIPATGIHTDTNSDGKCDNCDKDICTDHVWIDGEVKVGGNCTTDRVVAQVCQKCGQVGADKTITAPGHTEVIDAAVPATCTATGLTEGSHCSVCDEVIVAQRETPKAAHTFGYDDKCTNCGLVRYAKVKDVTTLKDGDVIVIYYPKGDLLLSGTASGTTLAGVGATFSDNYIYADNADELALTVRIDENGYYYFVTADEKYLTGESRNNLTLENALTDDAKWKFDTTGTNATLRIVNVNASYNSNALALEFYNNAFTVYTIGDKDIYNFEIYSYATPKITTVGASLNTGVKIRVTYDIPEAWLNANAGAKVAFTCEGETKAFDAVSGLHTYYVNLASHLINKDITVQVVDSEGNALTTPQDVSLSTYRAKLAAANATDLGMTEDKKTKALDLIDAALIHSAYASGESNKDITLTEGDFVASEVVKNFAGSITVKANLSAKIKLIIGITSKVAPTVTVDGQAVECTYVDNVLTIGGLYHTKFNDVIIISVGDTAVLTFSFNSYLKAIYDSNATDKNLAAATYLYGVAAEDYISAE